MRFASRRLFAQNRRNVHDNDPSRRPRYRHRARPLHHCHGRPYRSHRAGRLDVRALSCRRPDRPAGQWLSWPRSQRRRVDAGAGQRTDAHDARPRRHDLSADADYRVPRLASIGAGGDRGSAATGSALPETVLAAGIRANTYARPISTRSPNGSMSAAIWSA